MNTAHYLQQIARDPVRHAMPVLSFPAVQKLGVTVRQLVESSQWQSAAMEAVAREVPSIASVSLMDLSVEAEAFGSTVRFTDNEVPTIVGRLIEDPEEAEALQVPQVGAGRTGIYVEAVRQAKQRITDRPILGGVIGPFSLAGRLMDVTEIMYLCYDEPEAVHTVLRKAADFLISYCKAFRDAGADGIVMAEPLAGLLSAEMSEEFSCAYVKDIISAVQNDQFAVIYHNCGNAVPNMLPEIFSVGAAAYHFGNAVDLRAILDKAPGDIICMGNIDPAGQFAAGTPDSVRQATLSLLEGCGAKPNFILSSGCDIPPHAKWENIHAFFDALDEYNRRNGQTV